MKLYLSLVIIAIMITACGPSAEQMTATAAEAQTQTQTAAPTLTPTETQTPVPSKTPEPTTVPASVSTCGDSQEVDVTQGSYDCKEYVSADSNFSCRLDEIPNLGLNPAPGYAFVVDFPIESGWNGGGLAAQNFSSDKFFVEYFSVSNLPEEVKTLLEDPSTAEQGYDRIFEDLLLPGRLTLHSVENKEYREDEGLLIQLIHKPEDGQGYDYESTLIFLRTDYFYFVTVESRLIPLDPNREPSSENHPLQMIMLDTLFQACTFSS